MDQIPSQHTHSDPLEGLNPPQREAAQHTEGPILVLAGAGSGKTRVLTRRVANLVLNHHVNPSNILAVTFTNKAANEMKERLRTLLGIQADKLWMSTFHSCAVRILRHHAQLLHYPNSFVIYDDNDSKSLVKRILKSLNIDEKKSPVSSFTSTIDRAKNDFIAPSAFANNPRDRDIFEVYRAYQQALLDAGAMDFGDLLVNLVTLFNQYPDVLELYRHHFHYILIDEFQDTNKVQYMLVRQLATPRNNVFVVGDDDQSIYAFRGANIENILNFENDFPNVRVVTLEQNYRSTQNILNVAYDVISHNKNRKPKKLWTASDAGRPIITYTGYDEEEEADFIAKEVSHLNVSGKNFSDIAILYRTNAQSRAIEEAFIRQRIPYQIFGGLKFYERKEVKDILAYLRLIANEKDSQSFLRAISTPPRGIGTQTIEKISQTARSNNISLWQAACRMQDTSKNIKDFVVLIEEFKSLSKRLYLGELIKEIVSKTGYETKIKEKKEINGDSRIENIRELIAIGAATGAETPEAALQEFLDKVSLTTGDEISIDEKKKINSGTNKLQAVSLMTLHIAKGLEFPVVFLTGLEEGLLPHYKSLLTPNEIEEERRLCYVGITRAKQILYLTHATVRGMFSAGGLDSAATGRYRISSRFLNDISPEYLEDLTPDSNKTPSSSAGIKFDDWDDDDEDYYLTSLRRKKKFNSGESSYRMPPPMPEKNFSRRKNPDKFSMPFITTADNQGLELPPDALLLKDHIEKAHIGLRVLHSHFGEGTIISMDIPASKDPNKTKIKIHFDQSSEEKVLLLGKARLAII